MNCSKCGAPVTGDVCPYCGSPTYITGPQPSSSQEGYEENEWYDVPDSKPEPETSDDTVWFPDTQEQVTAQQHQGGYRSEPFYFKSWFVILMLFMFPVIGCALMWMGNKWSQTARIIITVLCMINLMGQGNYAADMFGGLVLAGGLL